MVQYGADGRVIPHYYGENYRGFDIFDTYRCFRGKWIHCWKGRNPYDDTDICQENIMHAPKNRCFKTRDEIVEYIEKYTFLAQPGMNETDVLCSSTWEYEQDDTGYWSLSL